MQNVMNWSEMLVLHIHKIIKYLFKISNNLFNFQPVQVPLSLQLSTADEETEYNLSGAVLFYESSQHFKSVVFEDLLNDDLGEW